MTLKEMLVDKREGPAQRVQFLVDWAEFRLRLTARQATMFDLLAAGHSTNEVAAQLGVSAAAVSIMRRTLAARAVEFFGNDLKIPAAWR